MLTVRVSDSAVGVAVHRPNPGSGLTSFDSFFEAMLNVLVVTTMANWSDITDPLWTATSSLVCLYMISLIFVGAFFAVNLVLVRASAD